MKIRCAIVDDEPVAARGIEKYAQQINNLKVAGVFASAMELNEFLSKNKVDLVFLDIEMPLINGIEWLKAAKNPPKIIFTTAYNEYAIEGYELDVVDYLLKPISFARFLKAVNKAALLFNNDEKEDHIFVKSEGRLEKLLFEEIYYVQGMQNYVTFHTQRGPFIAHLTLKSVVEQLPPTNFLQIHKSYLVNLTRVQAITGAQISLKDDTLLPIGNKWKEEVISMITDQKVMKKQP